MVDKRSKLVPFLLLLSFNLLQFSTYVLKLPPLFLLSKALLASVFVGGLLRLLTGDKSKVDSNLDVEFFSLDSVDKLTKLVFKKTNCVFQQAKSVVLWDNPVKSLYSLLFLYLLSLVLKVVPSVLVTLVVVWSLFLYVYMNEFFNKNVYRHFEPYVKKVVEFLYKLYETVPKLNEDKLL